VKDAATIAKRLAERLVLADADERPLEDELLARYDELDAKLVKAGFPETSAWWRETFERFIRSKKRQLVDRVGRRGGKSSSISRLAVVVALYGRHVIPPGDVGVVAIISTDRSEAMGRLTTIKAILDAMKVAYRPLQAPKVGIALVDRPIEFRVFAASIAGVSGFTAIFVLCDEVAKWRDKDTGANPATTVLASVRPTMATQPNARIVLSSSPMGRLDAHYDAFEEGTNELQVTAEAPTWIANPTITEKDTRALEPDEATRMREYGAVPQAEAESSLLTEYLVDRMTRPLAGDIPFDARHFYVATMDPATRGNAFTLTIATRGLDDVRRVVAVREKRGTPSAPLSPKETLREWKPLLTTYGLRLIHTDQWSLDAMQDSARDLGLTLKGEPWTQATKAEAYEELLKLSQDKLVEVGPEENVKSDLLGIRKVLTRNGVTYELRRDERTGRHSDYAPSIAMAVSKAIHRATATPRKLTTAEEHERDKAAFLEKLTREKRRGERFGRTPATHRRPMR
jgi:hypothetical protein